MYDPMITDEEARKLALSFSTWEEWSELNEYKFKPVPYGELQNGFEWAVRDIADWASLDVELEGESATFHLGKRSLTVRKVAGTSPDEPVAFIVNPVAEDDDHGQTGRQSIEDLDPIVRTWKVGRTPSGSEMSARRRALGLSQSEIAFHYEVTQDTVSKWEAGTRIPKDSANVLNTLESLEDDVDHQVFLLTFDARAAGTVYLSDIELDYEGMCDVVAVRIQQKLAQEGIDIDICQ